MAKKSNLSKKKKSIISLLVLLVGIGTGWVTTSDLVTQSVKFYPLLRRIIIGCFKSFKC